MPDRARILVCDDSATMRALIRTLLGTEHEVLLAETGEEAFRLAEAERPDLIVSDLLLPGISGSDLCRRIRETPALAQTPFVMVTTLADATSRALGLEAGADDYLYKPLRERELRARVSSLLRLRRAIADLEQRGRDLQAANTALQETQAALVRAEKLASVGLMAAGLAHEINNPLASIKAGARALVAQAAEVARLAHPPGAPAQPELEAGLQELAQIAADLADGSRRLERIAGDLRIMATPGQPGSELVDPGEVMERVFVFARARFPAMPRLDLAVEPGPPIESVERILTQGLLPVVENAVQAAGPGGTIEVRVRQLNVGVEISIRDSGPGIAPALLQRIFDPFFSTRPEGQGRGLGLSVAYGIIHGLGGDITVESAPGQGAHFRVRLPRSFSASAAPVPAPAAS